MVRRRIVLLGASGSIGMQAADVIAAHPEELELVALASGRGGDNHAALERSYPHARSLVGGDARALRSLVETVAPDLVVVATTGVIGLEATIAALEGGAAVAIANKETIVAGGDIVMHAASAAAARLGSDPLERLRPVDSEHSALWQCLLGEASAAVSALVLTASGGPLRTWTAAEIAAATPADALSHPTWSMGSKITVDSATLVNKGLEAIEAHRLFGLPMGQIDIVVHPQSVIHGLAEFVDGSTKAQLGSPDMRGPIAFALGYPRRMTMASSPVDLAALRSLTFEEPDVTRFPGLAIALEAGRAGGAAPGALIAADDVAVRRFLQGDYPLGAISRLLADAVDRFGARAVPSDLAAVIALHEEVSDYAERWGSGPHA